jgi:four helix bundle protein
MKESNHSLSANNTILTKSFKFSVRTLKAYKILIKRDSSLIPLFKQLLRSGTSIGANISEAQSAFTKKDFINKLGISLKEARETEYWLSLLSECDLLSEKEFKSLYFDCIEIIKLLTSIIKSSKRNRKS